MAGGKMFLVSKGKNQHRNRGKNRLYNTRRAPNPKMTSLSLKRGIGFPDRYTTTLSYSTYVKLDTASSGLPVKYVFRGNSLHDPDFTGTGQQPGYYDALAALYAHWMVWGSKITVHIINSEAVGTNPANLICVLPARTATASATVNLSTEQPRARYRFIRDGSDNVSKIVNSARTKQMLPSSANGWNQEATGIIGSNPADTWMWIIHANSANASAECVMELQVNIKFYCTWYERQQIPQS